MWQRFRCNNNRYYYPNKFITCALNIFADKEDKSLAIIDYAKRNGIKILPIKFGHSGAEYTCDGNSNRIYKGIASIKYMNSIVADELYALKDNVYEDFVDLLYDISEKTSLNSRQIKILIDLDYFDFLGDANYLARIYDLYDAFGGRKQINKEKVKKNGIELDLVRPFAGSESEKMFTKVDTKSFLKNIAKITKAPKRSLKERIDLELKHLGYINIAGDEYTGMAVVTDIDKKYTPRLKLYSLKHGDVKECKIAAKLFSKAVLKNGDIIKVLGSQFKPKMRFVADGNYEVIPGTSELWITKYKVINM